MLLLPILPTLEENAHLAAYPDMIEILPMTIDFFNRIGYQPPWMGYFAEKDGRLVGSCAFKDAPKEGKVEIAYGVFPQYQNQGIAGEMCRALVAISLETDPTVQITGRTLPESGFSTRVLERNGFVLGDTVHDEDGDVWEWIYRSGNPI